MLVTYDTAPYFFCVTGKISTDRVSLARSLHLSSQLEDMTGSVTKDRLYSKNNYYIAYPYAYRSGEDGVYQEN